MADAWTSQNAENTYQKMMNRFALPHSIYATKATADGPECFGNDRSIHHNHWAASSVVGRHRTRPIWFDFNNVVGPEGLRMSDASLKPDYMVKKILVLVGLGAGDSRPISLKVVQIRCQFYDRLVRWRISNGISCNDQIKMHHFEQYCESLSDDTLLSSAIEVRLDSVFSDLYTGVRSLEEFHKPAEKNKKQLFNWELLASLLGTTKLSLSNSRSFVVELCDRLSNIEHPLRESLVNSLIRDNVIDEKQGYAESSGLKLLQLWKILYTYTASGLFPMGGLSFNPYEKISLKQRMRQLELRPLERTGTLAPEDFMRLLKAACKWVFEYGDYILEAVQSRRALRHRYWAQHKRLFNARFDSIRPDGAPKLHHAWVISKHDKESKSERIALGDAMKHLMTACAIVIACFSARRGGEIMMLQSDCISQVGALYYLRVYIEKTLQRTDIIPVPEMVAAAVDVLKVATTQSNDSAKISPLFHVLRQDTPVFFEFTANLKSFAVYTELTPPEGQVEWNFSSHQLRRGAAIYYYYGNDWGELDNVAHLLRHFDPEMTRIYLTEAIAGAIGQLEDELRARSEVAKIRKSKELKKWLADAEEELGNLRALRSEFDEVRLEAYVYRMLAKGQHGLDEAIGHGVQRLRMDREAMIEAAAADVRIKSGANDEDRFQEALYVRVKQQAANRFLEPVPGGVAHCAANLNGGDDLSLAECNKLAAAGKSPWDTKQVDDRSAKVNLAFSGVYPCLTCIYGVLFKSNQNACQRKMEAVHASVATAPDEVAASARKEQFDRMFDAFTSARSAAGRA